MIDLDAEDAGIIDLDAEDAQTTQPIIDLDAEEETPSDNYFLEGLKGAGRGLLATVPFMPVTSPVQDAPAANSFLSGTERLARPIARGLGATVVGSLGGAAGVAGANMADRAIQIGAEQGVEAFTEKPLQTGLDIAVSGATSGLPFKFGGATTKAATEALKQGATKMSVLPGLIAKNAAVDTTAGVAQTAADAYQRGENPLDAGVQGALPNLAISTVANLLGARGAVKGAKAKIEAPESGTIQTDIKASVEAPKVIDLDAEEAARAATLNMDLRSQGVDPGETTVKIGGEKPSRENWALDPIRVAFEKGEDVPRPILAEYITTYAAKDEPLKPAMLKRLGVVDDKGARDIVQNEGTYENNAIAWREKYRLQKAQEGPVEAISGTLAPKVDESAQKPGRSAKEPEWWKISADEVKEFRKGEWVRPFADSSVMKFADALGIDDTGDEILKSTYRHGDIGQAFASNSHVAARAKQLGFSNDQIKAALRKVERSEENGEDYHAFRVRLAIEQGLPVPESNLQRYHIFFESDPPVAPQKPAEGVSDVVSGTLSGKVDESTVQADSGAIPTTKVGDPNVGQPREGQGQKAGLLKPIQTFEGNAGMGQPPAPPSKPPVAAGGEPPVPGDSGLPGKYVGSQNTLKMPINRADIASADELRLLKSTYEREAAAINKVKGGPRVTETVIEDATKSKVLDWDADRALKAFVSPAKEDFTDADHFALRSIAMGKLRKANQTNDKDSLNEFVAFMKASQVMANKAGRDLRSYDIQAKAWDSVLTTKDKTAVRLTEIFKDEATIPEAFKKKLLDLKPDDYTSANKLIQEAAATKHGKFWWVHPYVYFNLLSNPITHLGNAGANVAQTAGAVATKGVAGLLNVRKAAGSREVDIAELPAYLKGLGNGISDGAARAMYAWKNGFTQGQAKELKGSIFPQFSGIASILNTPGRALQSADEFFRAINAGGEAHALAVREAKKQVAKGGGSVKQLTELYLKHPTQEMTDAIDKAAARSVFQEELPKYWKGLENFLAQERPVGSGIQPGKFIQPFIQVPFNVSKQLLQNSPVGLAFLKAEGANKSEVLARTIIGTAPLLVLLPLIENGIIEVNGGIPKDQKERERFYADKKRPWSVRIGGRYVDLRYFGAFAAPLAVAGAYGQALKVKERKPDEAAIAQTVYGLSSYLFDASFFTGFSSFTAMLKDPEREGARFSANMASQWIPGGGLQRFLNQAPVVGDKWQREAETMWEKAAAGTVLGRALLPERLNSAGEKVERQGPFPRAGEDALYREFEKHDIGMATPARKQRDRQGNDIEITAEQQRGLLEGVNAPVAAKARELIASERYKKAQPYQQKLMLEAIMRRRDPLFNKTRRTLGLDFLKPR